MTTKTIPFLIFIFFLCSASSTANQSDTVVVRLKTGGKVRGTIVSSTSEMLTLDVLGVGPKNILLDDVALISSRSVYDSLVATQSVMVSPSTNTSGASLAKYFSGEFLVGNMFSNLGGFGLGFRGLFVVTDTVTVGVFLALHFGSDWNRPLPNSGPTFLWGPEMGIKIPRNGLYLEPLLGIGEATLTIVQPTRVDDQRISYLYFAPGFSFKADLGGSYVGLQYRYFIMKPFDLSALYITIGR